MNTNRGWAVIALGATLMACVDVVDETGAPELFGDSSAGLEIATPCAGVCRDVAVPADLMLVPWPRSVTIDPDRRRLFFSGVIALSTPSAELQPHLAVLAGEIAALPGIGRNRVMTRGGTDGNVVLELDPSLADEAYALDVDATAARVRGRDLHAVSLGTATLLQALANYRGTSLPRMTIRDQPANPYRGVMLDLVRKPHSLDSIKQIVDLARIYKVRYLQLYLTGDESFMLPMDGTPYAALNNPIGNRKGGPAMYTRAELVDLEAYATARGVTLVPGLSMPGHSGAAVRTMPELFKIHTDPSRNYSLPATINFAKPAVVDAQRAMVARAAEIFRSTPYIHMGGDEVDTRYAGDDPDVQAALAGGDDIHDLFRRFIVAIDAEIKRVGKRTLIWEGFGREISPRVPIPADVVIMEFESRYYPPREVVADGYSLINAAWTPLYVVNTTRQAPRDIYAWDRTRFGQFARFFDLATWIQVGAGAERILGAQMCSWEQPEQLELDSLRSRLPAMAERIWRDDALAPELTYEFFARRWQRTDRLVSLITQEVELDVLGVDDDFSGYFRDYAQVTMRHRRAAGQVRYTLDGKVPTATSPLYTGPVVVTATAFVRAALFDGTQPVGRETAVWLRQLDDLTRVGSVVSVSGGTRGAAYGMLDGQARDWDTGLAWAPGAATAEAIVDLGRDTVIERLRVSFATGAVPTYTLAVAATPTAEWTTVVDSAAAPGVATGQSRSHTIPATVARRLKLSVSPSAPGAIAKVLSLSAYPAVGQREAAPVRYTTINGASVDRYAHLGQHVAFLVGDPELDPAVMRRILWTFDRAYEFYAAATGRLPAPFLLHRGRLLIAVVDSSCGAGCGYLGSSGIELTQATFQALYTGVRDRGAYDQALFYELGRNFYFYNGQIRYQDNDGLTQGSNFIGTGYAVLMRFLAMDYVGVVGGPFGSQTYPQFRDRVNALAELYMLRPELTFDNTLRRNLSPVGFNATDLWASLLLQVGREFGRELDRRLWRAVAEIPAVPYAQQTTERAVDNLFLGVCAALGRNLTEHFRTGFRWPISTAAAATAVELYGGDVGVRWPAGPMPPTVTAVSPAAAEAGVAVTVKIQVELSQAMTAATVTSQSTNGACAGSVQLSADNFATCVAMTVSSAANPRFELTPVAPLAYSAGYRVRVTSAAQGANGLAAVPFTSVAAFTTQAPPPTTRFIFLSGAVFSPGAGGVATADALCNSSTARPPGNARYKALLAASTRRACSRANCASGSTSLDWVLQANQTYVRPDGKVVFTTNAQAIVTAYPLTNPVSSAAVNPWTGLNRDWTSLASGQCGDWTQAAGAGGVGWAPNTSSGWITGGTLPCSSLKPLFCVEQ